MMGVYKFMNFSQYGGYVTVDKLAGRALYYYFVAFINLYQLLLNIQVEL